MSLPGPVKVEAELLSSTTAPGTAPTSAPTTGSHIERILEDTRILAARERFKILQTQRHHANNLGKAKKERLQLSYKIGALTRDIRDSSRRLLDSATQLNLVQTPICEKLRQRRDFKQQKATLDQQVEHYQDEIFLLEIREEALLNQITRLTTQMLDVERTNEILREQMEYVRQKNLDIDAAAEVVRDKQNYICQTRIGIAGARKVMSEKQEYLEKTSKAAKAELDALTQLITSSAASA